MSFTLSHLLPLNAVVGNLREPVALLHFVTRLVPRVLSHSVQTLLVLIVPLLSNPQVEEGWIASALQVSPDSHLMSWFAHFFCQIRQFLARAVIQYRPRRQPFRSPPPRRVWAPFVFQPRCKVLVDHSGRVVDGLPMPITHSGVAFQERPCFVHWVHAITTPSSLLCSAVEFPPPAP